MTEEKKDARQQLVLARQKLVTDIAKARNARERLDAIISVEKSEKLVPTLPVEELFLTVKEVGLNDSAELVHLASPQQFRSFLDLDVWSRDSLDTAKTLHWLRVARTDEDEERYRKKVALLDMEVVELLLKRNVKVHDLREDDDPHLEGDFFRSPEGTYVVEFEVADEEYFDTKALLDGMYAEDPFRAARLLEAVRWEIASELEESALRWRTGRMADLGFPDLGEALSYFAYLDPDAALPGLARAPHVPAGFFLARLEPVNSFFDQALPRVPAEARDPLERQLVTVMNAVMVVEGVDPGDLDGVRRVLANARDTLSLGLEHASNGNLETAGVLLGSAPLKRVFQIGVSLALKLKFRADRLMRAGKASFPATKDVPLLDPPVGEVILALRRKRPQFCEALADHQVDPGVTRPFRNRAELQQTAEVLDAAEKLVDVMDELGFEPLKVQDTVRAARGEEQLAEVRFSDLFLSAVAREAVGEGFSFAPVLATRLGELLQRAFEVEGGRAKVKPLFEKNLRELVEGEAEGLSPAHQRAAKLFADFCLEKLVQDAGNPYAASGALDPKLPLPFLTASR